VQDLRIADLMDRLAQIPERRATFREEKMLAALDRPLHSEGRLHFRRPGHLEKTTTAPIAEALVVDGETLTITMPDQPPQIIALDDHPDLQALVDAVRAPLAGDLTMLRRHYGVWAEGGMAAWRISLRPTDPNVLRLLQTVEVDGSDTTVRSVRIVQANGDEQRMTIETAP
jgi:hypothetical protein